MEWSNRPLLGAVEQEFTEYRVLLSKPRLRCGREGCDGLFGDPLAVNSDVKTTDITGVLRLGKRCRETHEPNVRRVVPASGVVVARCTERLVRRAVGPL